MFKSFSFFQIQKYIHESIVVNVFNGYIGSNYCQTLVKIHFLIAPAKNTRVFRIRFKSKDNRYFEIYNSIFLDGRITRSPPTIDLAMWYIHHYLNVLDYHDLTVNIIGRSTILSIRLPLVYLYIASEI